MATTIEMRTELTTSMQAFNALSVTDADKAKSYKALQESIKELNKAETAEFYDNLRNIDAPAVEYFRQRISLSSFDTEKNDDGVVCKVTLSNKYTYVDPYEVLKRVGLSEQTRVLNYGARYYALLQCEKLGIHPDKSVTLVGKQFVSAYMGKKALPIEGLSVTKVCKECLQPVFDLFNVGLKANNIDVKFIDIGMAKHGKEAGQVVISNSKTYGKLLAEVLYCRLNKVRYNIA